VEAVRDGVVLQRSRHVPSSDIACKTFEEANLYEGMKKQQLRGRKS